VIRSSAVRRWSVCGVVDDVAVYSSRAPSTQITPARIAAPRRPNAQARNTGGSKYHQDVTCDRSWLPTGAIVLTVATSVAAPRSPNMASSSVRPGILNSTDARPHAPHSVAAFRAPVVRVAPEAAGDQKEWRAARNRIAPNCSKRR